MTGNPAETNTTTGSKVLACFDFDGTITNQDSLGHFLLFLMGRKRYYFGLLVISPVLAAYKFRMLSGSDAKERMLTYFLNGRNAAQFQVIADRYSLERIDRIIRRSAIKRINWHKEQGHSIVVVTASPECYLRGWCRMNGLDLIGTQMEVKDGNLTGRFSSGNCKGKQKPVRIKEKYDLDSFAEVYAYGDSENDKEMMMLADHRFYKFLK